MQPISLQTEIACIYTFTRGARLSYALQIFLLVLQITTIPLKSLALVLAKRALLLLS